MERSPDRTFPPADLMEKLIDGYFDNMNMYLPLLHAPTFRRRVADAAHLHDPAFGAVLLLVCATGSRWTDDPRAQTDDGTTPGWGWFTQVDTVRWSIFERPKVEDVQACAVRDFLPRTHQWLDTHLFWFGSFYSSSRCTSRCRTGPRGAGPSWAWGSGWRRT